MAVRWGHTSEIAWVVIALVWCVVHVHGVPYPKPSPRDQHHDSRLLSTEHYEPQSPEAGDRTRLQKMGNMADLLDLLMAFKQTYTNIYSYISPDDTTMLREPRSGDDDTIPFMPDFDSLAYTPPNYSSDFVLFPSLRRNLPEIVPYTKRADEYSSGSMFVPSKRQLPGLTYGCDLRKVTLNIMIEYLKSGKICGTPISHVRYGLGRK